MMKYILPVVLLCDVRDNVMLRAGALRAYGALAQRRCSSVFTECAYKMFDVVWLWLCRH